VQLHSGVLLMQGLLPPRHQEQRTGPCASADVSGPALALAVGSECLASRDGFECSSGSQLEVWRDGKATPLGPGGVARFVPRERDVLLLDQCCYLMGCVEWRIESLARSGDGSWTRKLLAHGQPLDESVLAFALDNDGGVDLLVADRSAPASTPHKPPCFDRTRVEGVNRALVGGFVVVHVDQDGAVTARE
jgi:hypothetical protein